MQQSTGWWRWLTPGLEVKRWLLLLMLSQLIIVLGLAYLLKDFYRTAPLPGEFFFITLQFIPRWMRGLIFGALGIGLLVFAVVKLQNSVLGPFLPGGERSIAEQIYAFRTRNRGPRMVAIGGGAHGVNLHLAPADLVSALTADLVDVTEPEAGLGM